MQLSEGTHVALIGDRAIVLDVHGDRYLSLGHKLSRTIAVALGRIVDSEAGRIDRTSAITELASKGVISETDGSASRLFPPYDPEPLNDSLWPTRRYGIGIVSPVTLNVSVLTALTRVQYSLSRNTFRYFIDELRRRKLVATETVPRYSLQDAIDAYFALRPWFPYSPICRLDAPALSWHLWANGHQVDLVFGVRLEPFKAHCWVQRAATALSEPDDRLRQFSPIMTI